MREGKSDTFFSKKTTDALYRNRRRGLIDLEKGKGTPLEGLVLGKVWKKLARGKRNKLPMLEKGSPPPRKISRKDTHTYLYHEEGGRREKLKKTCLCRRVITPEK